MNWSSIFCIFWHGIGQTIIDSATDEWRGGIRTCVQADGGHFKQLLWQYSAIWQAVSYFLKCDITRNANANVKLREIRTSNFCKVVLQHTEEVLYGLKKYYMGFVGNLLLFSRVLEFWKSVKNW